MFLATLVLWLLIPATLNPRFSIPTILQPPAAHMSPLLAVQQPPCLQISAMFLDTFRPPCTPVGFALGNGASCSWLTGLATKSTTAQGTESQCPQCQSKKKVGKKARLQHKYEDNDRWLVFLKQMLNKVSTVSINPVYYISTFPRGL